jgi:hypothetical protein
MALPELTGDMMTMAGASPKAIAAISFLRLFEKYFDNMATNPDVNIDRMTAAMLICCPEKQQRELMWNKYTEERNAGVGTEDEAIRIVSASVHSVGDLYEYMSNAMGLNEKSTGGG